MTTCAYSSFTLPYQNNIGRPAYYIPWYTNVNKCIMLWTLSLYHIQMKCASFGRDRYHPCSMFFMLVQWFVSPLSHIGLQFSLESCIWTAIGHDISNIAILPNCHLRWDKNVILVMFISLSKPLKKSTNNYIWMLIQYKNAILPV